MIFVRAKFNLRSQKENEPVNNFITDLYCLSEYCEFGTLKNDLIRDRIVVGLKDKKLSEQLQLDSKLTLEKAITKSRQSETVKKQQFPTGKYFGAPTSKCGSFIQRIGKRSAC